MSNKYSSETLTPRPKATYGWLVFGISVLFVFFKYVLEVSPSIMTRELMADFHIDAALVGHIAASYYYAYTIMQIPGGLLVDAYGPRKMSTIGILVCSVGALLFAFSENLLIISIARFLMGLGAAFAILNTLKISSNWFPSKRFALLTGLTLTLGTLGAVFGQAPLSYVIHRIGWRQSFTDLAIFGFIFSLIFWTLVRNKPRHKAYDVTPETKDKIKISTALAHMLKRPQTWILSLYSGLAFAPVLSFAGLWGVTFIEIKYQIDHIDASFFTSLVFIGFAIGAPLLGWYSSLIGKRKPIMYAGTSLALILIVFAIYYPPISHALFGTTLFFIGFAISSFLLSFTIIHEINIPLMTATAIGIMNTFNALLGAFTEPFIGFFLDISSSPVYKEGARIFTLRDYHLAFIVLPIYLLVCVTLLFFIKETNSHQTLSEKEQENESP